MTQKILNSLLGLFVALTAFACDKNEDVTIPYESLPEQAQLFISQNFPSARCVHAEKDTDNGTVEYEALLSDGTKLDFDAQGVWKSVDCTTTSLPKNILPNAIETDISQRYPQAVIYKVEKERNGYEVDITGWELHYNLQGSFLRAERD